MKTTVTKSWLLNVVSENLKNHDKIFEEALEGYKKQCISQLEAYLERIKRGDVIQVYVSMPQPVNQRKAYERVLDMIANNQDNNIILDEADYAAYVLDEWSWKDAFIHTNSSYSVTAKNMK